MKEEIKESLENKNASNKIDAHGQEEKKTVKKDPSLPKLDDKANELGYTLVKLRPTSPNTPHITHIKAKNVVKKFAFATRVGYEVGNTEKVN